MYTRKNYKTKKALKDAFKAGESIEIYSPGPFPAPRHGTTTLEGPHYPQPHTWYASVKIENLRVVKILS